MNEGVFATIQRAVNLAKERNVRTLATLRKMLCGEGFSKSEVDEALTYWAKYERGKK